MGPQSKSVEALEDRLREAGISLLSSGFGMVSPDRVRRIHRGEALYPCGGPGSIGSAG